MQAYRTLEPGIRRKVAFDRCKLISVAKVPPRPVEAFERASPSGQVLPWRRLQHGIADHEGGTEAAIVRFRFCPDSCRDQHHGNAYDSNALEEQVMICSGRISESIVFALLVVLGERTLRGSVPLEGVHLAHQLWKTSKDKAAMVIGDRYLAAFFGGARLVKRAFPRPVPIVRIPQCFRSSR